MCAASYTKARIPARQTDTRKDPPAAASLQATHHRAPPAAHMPRALSRLRDRAETTEFPSSAASAPRGSFRSAARPVPAPRRWQMACSLPGAIEMREFAVVIIANERSHKISSCDPAPRTGESSRYQGRVAGSVDMVNGINLNLMAKNAGCDNSEIWRIVLTLR